MAKGVGVFDGSGRRKYLSGAERRAFFEAIIIEPDELRRTFCQTLYFTGCRISEALSVTVERIDLQEKNFAFETLKRRRRGVFRAVPVPNDLASACAKAAVGLEPSARLWPFSRATAYRLVKGHMAAAGIGGIMACPKGLRHGFAVACLSQKIPLPTVQKWMGHARMETTAIYLEVSGEEERALARRLWACS
jgi:integrase/recombinase XerD